MSKETAKVGTGTRRGMFDSKDRQKQYDFEVLDVARVVRVVKGGRRFSFRATAVVGSRSGMVGIGVGRSKDVQSAINKAYDKGVKDSIMVKIKGATISHDVIAKYGGARLMMRPAKPGTGIIAGGIVRLVVDLAGISDLVSKRYGSTNKINTARAALEALRQLKE